jgi:hypothetical protein
LQLLGLISNSMIGKDDNFTSCLFSVIGLSL